MISNIQRNIIIRALRIRKEQGENPEDILDKYMNLTSTDKAEIMEKLVMTADEPMSRYCQKPFSMLYFRKLIVGERRL